jgi:hypothetical protein
MATAHRDEFAGILDLAATYRLTWYPNYSGHELVSISISISV